MESIAQSQYNIALLTLALVAIELLILVPAMLREIRQLFNESRRKKLDPIFNGLRRDQAISVSRLREITGYRDAALRAGLRYLEDLGKITNSQSPDGEEWMRVWPPRK